MLVQWVTLLLLGFDYVSRPWSHHDLGHDNALTEGERINELQVSVHLWLHTSPPYPKHNIQCNK